MNITEMKKVEDFYYKKGVTKESVKELTLLQLRALEDYALYEEDNTAYHIIRQQIEKLKKEEN